MANQVICNLLTIQASEILTHIVLEFTETAQSAREVVFQGANFAKFSAYLDKTSHILKQLSNQNLARCESSVLKNALDILDREVKSAKQLVVECRERSRVYLLLNCRNFIERIERSTKEISRALSLIPLASLDLSLSINGQITEICNDMLRSEYRSNVAEEKVLEKIELGIQESDRSRSNANELLLQIAKALGISKDSSELRRECEEFKREIEQANLRKEEEECSQMEQIMALLEKADTTTNSEDKERKYIERRNSLGSQRLDPLNGFICVLTQKVMVDPVETSSGQTFERSAIEKYMADGNELCPLTNDLLDPSYLRPNRTLRQSIEEWSDMNSIISIASLKPKLFSSDEEDVLRALREVQNLYEKGQSYQEKIDLEDFVPAIIVHLGGKNKEIRKNALLTLRVLANRREQNKEKITELQNSLEYIVRSLPRQPEESKLALRLLLDLSRRDEARGLIGNVHGCILVLVTLLSSDDEEVSKDAEELIEILSFLEQNVRQMAKANYFKPLLKLLCSGPEDAKIRMAETLAEIELTDHSKLSIVKNGALIPLIQMLSDDDLEKKQVSIRCLVQLSSLPENGLLMFEEGIKGPLFEILYRPSLQLPTGVREQVAATIMHLSLSAMSKDSDTERVRILESEEDVFKFFSLVSLAGPDIKRSILKTFIVLCQSPSSSDIRTRLRQISAVQVLVQLCEGENQDVRANAVELFCCLTKDGDDNTFLEHVNQKFIETLLAIIKSSKDIDEISAALGIIAHLPKARHVTQWLIDAEALRIIHTCLVNRSREPLHRNQVVESGVEAVCRFTVPTNQDWQMKVAQAGIIGLLVQFLATGNDLTKRNAAVSLKQLSESSKSLSKQDKKSSVCFFFCFSHKPDSGCPVHLGTCETESSFCLIKANAVGPLVVMLGERDLKTREASLDALLTLLDAANPRDTGGVLDKVNAIAPIIKMLSSDSVRVQEKCLKSLEIIFQVDELIKKYKNSVQMPLVDITQMKACDQTREVKSLAAKLLSKLGVLGAISSFF